MKISRSWSDASEIEKLYDEMQDEIREQKNNLKRYTSNIDSLLGYNRSKEVKKAMIEFLLEQL